MSKTTANMDFLFTKSVEEDDGSITIRGYANTIDKDRAGDVIPEGTWKTTNALTNYMKNPILLAFHDHSKPIGNVMEVNVTEKGLEVVGRISKGAGAIYDLIKDGVLKAFSVGFRILDADYIHDLDTFLIKDLELHEISVVSVPCNQESIFSLEKSLSASDYKDLKKQFSKEEAPTKLTVEDVCDVKSALAFINQK